jgi:hypothetical protein
MGKLIIIYQTSLFPQAHRFLCIINKNSKFVLTLPIQNTRGFLSVRFSPIYCDWFSQIFLPNSTEISLYPNLLNSPSSNAHSSLCKAGTAKKGGLFQYTVFLLLTLRRHTPRLHWLTLTAVGVSAPLTLNAVAGKDLKWQKFEKFGYSRENILWTDPLNNVHPKKAIVCLI